MVSAACRSSTCSVYPLPSRPERTVAARDGHGEPVVGPVLVGVHGRQQRVVGVAVRVDLPPARGAGDPARAAQGERVVHGGQDGDDLGPVQHPDRPARGRLRPQRRPRRADPDGACPGGDAVAVPAVDAALDRPQQREHVAAGAQVVELGAHQRGGQAPAGAVGPHPHAGHRRQRQHRAARHRGARRVGHRGADQPAVRVERPERAPRRVRPAPAGPPRVVDRRAVQRAAEQVVRGAQLAVGERADRVPAQAGRPTW